ncbi:hypothetical protein BA953_13860 [Vibrio coralliilyticus]|uniref:DUF3857 domain-containing protein n=1 Tax=Vibrio coralliilyticus TaxID=190893 RepID=UPI0008104070|nr:DUF3857 domain-containing protein [Vibrio coralliilyticus]ANW25189.1 hypothetical protein BA953_13860 [Vibrio coralliilyticus]
MKKFIIFTLVSFGAIAADDKESVVWQQDLTANRTLIEQANVLKDSVANTDTMTRLLYQQYFDIQARIVERTVTIVDYYPDFIDTEEYGSKSIYFDRYEQQVDIIAATTISPQGELVNVDPKLTKLLDTHSENTFTDQQQLLIPLPSLKKGSISIVKYRTTTTRSEQNDHWSNQSYTRRSYPILNYLLEANWRPEEVIQWKANTKDVVCTDQAHGMQCRGENIESYQHDNSTRWQDHIGRIEISNFSNWQQVIDRANAAMSEAENDVRGLDSLYAELSQKAKDTDEVIANILEFVARDIRYVSMSEAEHSITPHTFYETINNRYGDCKDKSTLLKALLAKAGIDSRLVLVDTDRFNQDSMLLPAMNHFNHVVVCFDLSGKKYCLDPTDNYTNWQSTPTWIQGKASLVLENNQSPESINASPYRWKVDSEVTLQFDQQGGQLEQQSRIYTGEYASYYRRKLLSRSKEEQQQFLEEEYDAEVSSLATPNFLVTHVNDMNALLKINSDAEFEPFLDPKEKKLSYYENDAWLAYELSSMKLENEWHSETFSGISVSSKYTFDLTNSPWLIKYLPSTVTFQHKYGSMIRTVEMKSDNKFNVATQVKIRAQTVPGEEIESFNNFIQILKDHSQIQFTAFSRA